MNESLKSWTHLKKKLFPLELITLLRSLYWWNFLLSGRENQKKYKINFMENYMRCQELDSLRCFWLPPGFIVASCFPLSYFFIPSFGFSSIVTKTFLPLNLEYWSWLERQSCHFVRAAADLDSSGLWLLLPTRWGHIVTLPLIPAIYARTASQHQSVPADCPEVFPNKPNINQESAKYSNK